MAPNDAIDARDLLTELGIDYVGKDAKAISRAARDQARKHKLTEWPSLSRKGAIIYSRAQVKALWKNLKPLAA